MNVAVLEKDGRLQLPMEVAIKFKPKDKFIVAVADNIIFLNVFQQPKLSSIAEKDLAEPMPMEEIVKEVHQYRKEKGYKK